MDNTKLMILRGINYTFPPTCGRCRFSSFQPPLGKTMWGTCGLHKYKHEKHTGEERELSIHLLGGCDAFESRPEIEAELYAFTEFLT